MRSTTRARQLTWHGDLRAAKRQARRALETGRAAGEEADSLFGAQLYLILWNEGRLTEMGGALASMPLEVPLDRAFACHAYAHLRRLRDAERLLGGLAARDFSDVPYNGFWLTVMALVADVAARVAQHPRSSTSCTSCCHPGATSSWSHPRHASAAWRTTSACSPPDSTDRATRTMPLLQATEIHERMNAPIWTARTRLEWGRSLLTRDHERGAVQLSLAHDAAHPLGAHDIVAEAAALARS